MLTETRRNGILIGIALILAIVGLGFLVVDVSLMLHDTVNTTRPLFVVPLVCFGGVFGIVVFKAFE